MKKDKNKTDGRSVAITRIEVPISPDKTRPQLSFYAKKMLEEDVEVLVHNHQDFQTIFTYLNRKNRSVWTFKMSPNAWLLKVRQPSDKESPYAHCFRDSSLMHRKRIMQSEKLMTGKSLSFSSKSELKKFLTAFYTYFPKRKRGNTKVKVTKHESGKLEAKLVEPRARQQKKL